MGGMADEREIRLTPRRLRALSHPLRTRMLGLLRTDGPATATTLAVRLGESSGATSYHLRQLAAYGFIEEDPAHATRGRERWWRSAHALTVWDEIELVDDAETRGALDTFLHTVLDEHMRRVATFVAEAAGWDRPWREASGISDAILRLGPGRARELQKELDAVIERYRDDPSGDADDAEQVIVGIQIFPRRTQPGEPWVQR